jgi:hypothetical protein
MAANLAWLQKWTTQLGWTDAWSDGWPLSQSGEIAAVGHMGLTQSGLGYLIRHELGDLTLAMVGHAGLGGNPTSVVPGEHTLGNLSLALGGHVGLSSPTFNTVDPWWIDPPNMLRATGHIGFPNVVTISVVVLKPLGNLSLAMTGHAGLSSPSVGKFVSHNLGNVALNLIGGLSMTADLVNKTGAAHALGDLTLALYGRTTLAQSNLRSLLPPHALGDVTLPLVGHATVATPRVFSGGPIALGNLALNMSGKLAGRFDLSYPPFDTGTEVVAALDPSVGTIMARVEPMDGVLE